VIDGNSDPVGLTATEQEVYDILKRENLRLEQERILHADVVKLLKSNFG